MAYRMHYNDPRQYGAPWEDAGKHKTRTAGLRRLWLHPPSSQGGQGNDWWTCAIAGAGSTGGATKDEALQRAKEW